MRLASWYVAGSFGCGGDGSEAEAISSRVGMSVVVFLLSTNLIRRFLRGTVVLLSFLARASMAYCSAIIVSSSSEDGRVGLALGVVCLLILAFLDVRRLKVGAEVGTL